MMFDPFDIANQLPPVDRAARWIIIAEVDAPDDGTGVDAGDTGSLMAEVEASELIDALQQMFRGWQSGELPPPRFYAGLSGAGIPLATVNLVPVADDGEPVPAWATAVRFAVPAMMLN